MALSEPTLTPRTGRVWPAVADPSRPEASRLARKRRRLWSVVALLGPVSVVYLLLFIVPLGIMGVYSLWVSKSFQIIPIWTLENYLAFFQRPAYVRVLGKTLWMAAVITLLTTTLAYFFAYFLVKKGGRHQKILVMFVIVPFWTSFLLRTYSWMGVLGEKGVINQTLIYLGVIREPLDFLLYNKFSVIIASIHLFIPFSIISLYTALEKMDWSLVDAAKDLGAGPIRAFWRVTLPQTMTGIWAAILFVFIPSLGLYITPALVGGADGAMIANLVVNQFEVFRLGLGAAISFLITLLVILFLLALRRYINLEKIYSQ